MPRRKALSTDEDGQPVAAVDETPRPEGWSETAWAEASAIGQALGNISLAMALMDVTSGKRAPKDDRETADLTEAARKLEARSYKRYTRMRDSIGAKLFAAKRDNLGHVDMLSVLRAIEEDPKAAVRLNGHSDDSNPAPWHGPEGVSE